MISAVDPDEIRDGNWEVFEVTPEYRRSRLWLDDTQTIVRTEYLAEDDLIASNQQSLHDSQNQRFGDGKVVARVPMHKWAREIAPRLQEGDDDFTKWWLNHENNRPYRSFRGRV